MVRRVFVFLFDYGGVMALFDDWPLGSLQFLGLDLLFLYDLFGFAWRTKLIRGKLLLLDNWLFFLLWRAVDLG